MTFLFHHIPGPAQEQIRQMQKKCLVLWEAGKLDRTQAKVTQNALIFCPELCSFPMGPVTSAEKQTVREVTINDGLHYHGLLLVPTKSRLKVPFLQHLRDKKRAYNRRSILTEFMQNRSGITIDLSLTTPAKL